MKKILFFCLKFLANQLPKEISFEQRLLLIKIMFLVFLSGIIFTALSYLLSKILIKKIKSQLKQWKRIRRLKAKKIAGAIFVGEVKQVFKNIDVAVIEIMAKKLNVTDQVLIKGMQTDLKFEIKSMQINHQAVNFALKGSQVGIKVPQEVRNGDLVYKIK